MSEKMKLVVALRKTLSFILLLSATTAQAEFLELPDIVEVPELERKSMLEDMDIPPVRDRDPDPEGGPRLAVSEFRLQGLVEYPELGITRAELAKIVEGIRFDMMEEEKLLKSGFSLKELGELSDLIVDIEDELGDRHAGALEVQRLVWLVREQRAKRGLTLGMIESVADEITKYYRERGFILAKAFIPEQKVRDGIVSLTLLLGDLGEVKVLDNKLYSDSRISGIFDDILDQPVVGSAIEERLYLLNDYPGLSVSGFFEPGSQVGDTRLNINTRSENRFDYNLRLDNHGSEQSSKNRLYGEAFWNNPFGLADQLQVGLLYADDPTQSTFGRIRYSTRVISPRTTLSFGATTNDFIAGQNDENTALLTLKGKTNQKDIELSYALNRGRIENSSIFLIAEEVESIIRYAELLDIDTSWLDDKVQHTVLGYRFDALDEKSKILHQAEFRLMSGEFIYGQELNQDKKYNLLRSNYTMLGFWNVPWLDVNSRFILNAEFQYAGKRLSSIDQLVMGGASRVKAYPLNDFSADDMLYTGASLVFDAPKFLFNGRLQPLLFVDAAYGISRSLSDAEEDATATMAGAGFGFQLSSLSKVRGNLMFAFPMHKSISNNEQTSDDGMRILLDVQYSF